MSLLSHTIITDIMLILPLISLPVIEKVWQITMCATRASQRSPRFKISIQDKPLNWLSYCPMLLMLIIEVLTGRWCMLAASYYKQQQAGLRKRMSI